MGNETTCPASTIQFPYPCFIFSLFHLSPFDLFYISLLHLFVCTFYHCNVFVYFVWSCISSTLFNHICPAPEVDVGSRKECFFLPPKEIQCIILPVKRFCLTKITAIPYSSPWICFKSKLEILYKVSNLTFLKVGTVEYSFCKNIMWLRMPMEK